jgi:hypothetical protein
MARAERVFNQAELDALLAPVALYPDAVLSNVLVAAGYPDDVRQAAAWSRANPQLRGDDALRLVENTPWQPSVKALVAFPEVLTRMDESPNWLRDLGDAYRIHGPYVMDTVQALRRRAQASGYLQSDNYQQVYDDGGAIAIAPAPAYPQYVYVRYYDPLIVYGPWWWPAYRPVFWRPWPVYGTFVSFNFGHAHTDWRRRTVIVNRPVVNRQVVVNRPVIVNHPTVVRGPVVVDRPVTRSHFNGPPSPAAREQQKYTRERHQERVQQANRMPPAQGFHGRDSRPGPAAQPHGGQGRSFQSGRQGGHQGGGRGNHRG